MNSLKKSLNIAKRVFPNFLKSLINYQVKYNFSVFYHPSNMNFSKITKISNTAIKESNTLVKEDIAYNIETNRKFFGYSDQYNHNDSFHKIIHGKPDPNETKLNEKYHFECYLYSENRDTSKRDITIIFDRIYEKKVLITLNHNDGVKISHLLEFLKYNYYYHDFIFLPKVKMLQNLLQMLY